MIIWLNSAVLEGLENDLEARGVAHVGAGLIPLFYLTGLGIIHDLEGIHEQVHSQYVYYLVLNYKSILPLINNSAIELEPDLPLRY